MRDNAQYQSQLTVIRTSWDPTELPTKINRDWNDIRHGELHHTGGRGPVSLSFEHKRRWLLAIERFHELTKGWTDIFYHVFVFADGEVWAGRMPLRMSQSNIKSALTIHLPGDNPVPTIPQINAIKRLLWAYELESVWDHRTRPVDPGTSYCAGGNVRAILPELNKAIKEGPAMPIPQSVLPDIAYALKHGIASEDPDKPGTMRDPDEFVPAWRAVVFASRAAQQAVANSVDQERLDEIDEQLDSFAQSILELGRMVDRLKVADVDVEGIVARVVADVKAEFDNSTISLSQEATLRLP
jgi:hypothetical protein